jgi:hypothetical protein
VLRLGVPGEHEGGGTLEVAHSSTLGEPQGGTHRVTA